MDTNVFAILETDDIIEDDIELKQASTNNDEDNDEDNDKLTHQINETSNPVFSIEKTVLQEKCKGFLSQWNTNQNNGKISIARSSVRNLALAILASVDELSCNNDPNLSICSAINSSPIVDASLQIVKIGVHPIWDHSHKIFVTPSEFNPKIHVTALELQTNLSNASFWTLAKAFTQKFCAGINKCFHNSLKDLPFSDLSSNKNRNADNEVISRSTDNATWGYLASSGFSDMLYEISDTYNAILSSPPDFSEAYKEFYRIKRLTYTRPTNIHSKYTDSKYTNSKKNNQIVNKIVQSGRVQLIQNHN